MNTKLADMTVARLPTMTFARRYLLTGCLLAGILFVYLQLGSEAFSRTSSQSFQADAADSNCEPYTRPAHLNLNTTDFLSTELHSYDTACQASNNWIQQLQHSLETHAPIPSLTNKEVLLIGDSVDRRVLIDLCTQFLGLNVTVHPMNNLQETSPVDIGGLPHTCTIPHLNLTITNYFFYGFDEADMWKSLPPYNKPGRFTERWSVFTDAVKTLRSGGRPDLVIANVGLWELLRHHALSEHSTPVDPLDLNPRFQADFLTNTEAFLRRIRAAVGPQTRIRFRENHTPATDENNRFTSEKIRAGKKRVRYTGVRIDTLNALIDEAIRRVNADGDDIRVWPIGKLMRPWPPKMWVADDCHPKRGVLAAVWGEGILEYAARAPRVVLS